MLALYTLGPHSIFFIRKSLLANFVCNGNLDENLSQSNAMCCPSASTICEPVKAKTTSGFPSNAVTVSVKKFFSAKSSLSAIQIYLPRAKSKPLSHCLKVVPLFCSLNTIWVTRLSD